MSDCKLVWYAARLHPSANTGRPTKIVGAEYKKVRGRSGASAFKRVPKTGERHFAIEYVLRQRGFHVLYPTRTLYRTTNRYTGEKSAVRVPLLKGWVLVGWPLDRPNHNQRLQDLLRIPLITGIAGRSGKPLFVPCDQINKLRTRLAESAYHAPLHHSYMRTGHEFEVGDIVKVLGGPLSDMEGKVINIDGSEAKLLIAGLGKLRINTLALSVLQ